MICIVFSISITGRKLLLGFAQPIFQPGALFLIHTEAVSRSGERPAADLFGIIPHGLLHQGTQFRIPLDETRRKLAVQPEHVMQDEHLTVAVGPRPYADGGNGNPGRNRRRERCGNGLKHNGETPGVFERRRLIKQLPCCFGALALHLEAAKLRGPLEASPICPMTGMPAPTSARI